MKRVPTSVVRVLAGWGLAILGVAAVAGWYFTRDALPPAIRIATALPGGQYQLFAERLRPILERATGHPVTVVHTAGTEENLALLARGEVELALLQDGAGDDPAVARLAPLWREASHIVVRRDGPVHGIGDLRDGPILVGPIGSGMRRSAFNLLRHYGLDIDEEHALPHPFTELPERPEVVAAIVTTGSLNPDLGALLRRPDTRLLPIPDGPAIHVHQPYFHATTIPRGLFRGEPLTPAADVPTVATTCYLSARRDTSASLVRATLAALYDGPLARGFPTLIPLQEARAWKLPAAHPAAVSYFNPYGGLDVLSNFMESLSAFKELLFAVAAGAYLIWKRWQRAQRLEREAELSAMKERLDVFLAETIAVEEAQMETTDPAELERHLDAVTRIKLRALRELGDEDLRGDRLFAIFLTQCANLIRKIQTKILTYSTRSSPHADAPRRQVSRSGEDGS